MDRIRYAFGVLLVVGLPPAILWWFVVHPFVGFWRRVGARRTLWIVGLLMVALMVPLGFARNLLLGRDLGTHWILVFAGAGFLVLSTRIARWRKRYLTMRILSGVPELDASGTAGPLLTEGPYALVRHPRYIEVVFGVVGYALLANYVGTYLLAVATLPALHVVVLLEERELAARFGPRYEEYRRRVPRYFPRSDAWRALRHPGRER